MTSNLQTPTLEEDRGDAVPMNVRRWRIGVGAVFLLAFIGYLVEAFSLPLGTPRSPGAGLFPVVIGVAGVAISAVVVIEALARKTTDDETLPRGAELRNVLFFIGSLVAAVLLLPVLGMYVTATAYTAAVAWYLGPRPKWRGALIGAVVVLGACVIFIELLEVRLPRGFW